MKSQLRPARVNVKAVVILVLIVGVLGVGGVGGHHIRKRVMAKRAYEAGQAALAQGDLPEACVQLQRYLEQYPDDIETLETYARARLSIRPRTPTHLAAAIAALRRLLRHKPHDDELCDRLARLYLMTRDYKNAASVCLRRLEADPDDVSANMNLARSRMGEQDFEEAIKLLEPLIQQHPEEVEACGLLVIAVLQADESEQAVSSAANILNACTERNPKSPLAFIQRGRFHRDTLSGRKQGDAVAARADLEKADSLNPVKAQVLLDLAHEWAALGEPQRSDATLRRIQPSDATVLTSDETDPDGFALAWYLVKSNVVRQLGVEADMAKVATDGLTELGGVYRSAFMENAIDLYLMVGEVQAAERVLEEYRERVTGSRQGGTSGNELLSLFLARLAYAQDRPYEVIELLEPVVARNPRSYPGWRLLGQAYVVTKQSRRAIRVLEECVRLRPNDESATMQLVKEFLRQRQWTKAMQYARTLGRADLDASLVRLEASLRIAVERRIPSATVRQLKQELYALREEHPESSAVRMLLAALAEYESRHDDAIAELRSAIQECDDPLDPAMQLAWFLRRLGRLEEAIDVCEMAVQRSLEVARPWIRGAEYLVRAERFDDARTKLEEASRAVVGTQQKREISLARARLHLRLDEREPAIAKFKEIAAEASGDVWSRVSLLELPEVLAESSEAQRYVDELKEIEGGRSGVLWRLHQARTWLASPEWKTREQDIVDVLTHCRDADPDWTRPVLILGRMYEMLKDLNRAEEVYRRLLEVRPEAIDVVDRLLRLLEHQNRVTEAKAVLDGLPPDLPGLTDHRVGLATASGEFETAIRELQHLVESDPRDEESRILLARLIYREQRDAKEAFRLLDEVDAINPEMLAVSAVRAFVLLSEGRADDAERVLDAEVDKRNAFPSYLLRAQFHLARGRAELAERDYLRLTTFQDQAAGGYEVLGRFYSSQERWEDAIGAWEKGLQAEPDRLSTQRMLMKVLLVSDDEGRRGRGIQMLDDLLSRHPDDADFLGVRAHLLLKEGTVEATGEAKAILERVVDLDGRAVKASLALMQIEFSEGNIATASDVITRALGFNPGHLDLLLSQAELERAQLHLPRALELAKLVLEQDPNRTAAYAVLTDVAFLSDDLEEAAAMSSEAARRAPQDARIQLKRAAVLEAMGQRAEAIRVLDDFVTSESGEKNTTVLLELADLYCREENYEAFDERVAQVERLLARKAGTLPEGRGIERVVRKRARCLGFQGRFGEIVPLISRHRAEFAHDTDTVLMGANLLAASGSEQYQREAQLFFEYVAEVNPKSIAGHLGVAQTSYMLGDIERTLGAYRKVLALDPRHNQALNDLAWILAVDERDLKGAIELADRGVERYPDDPHLLDTRGVVLTKLNRLAEAENDLILGVELAEARGIRSTQARALIHLAEVYEKLGEPSAARARLESAKAIDQEYGVLSDEERADIEKQMGRL